MVEPQRPLWAVRAHERDDPLRINDDGHRVLCKALARFLADYLADRPRGKGYVMNPLARDEARIGFAFMEEARAFGLHVEAEEYASRASGAADMQLIKVENTRSDGVTG